MNAENKKKISDYIKDENEIGTKRVNSAVIIPALNPMPNFVKFICELLNRGVPQIIVVNDGSCSSFNDVFREVGELEQCTVLSHEINRGKGRALKTAFTYVIENYSYLDGVVTADADGQHSVEDIYRVCEKLSLNEGSLILGTRDLKKMPKRSYIGNLIAGYIFEKLYNSKVNDTQTGLRGIPISELKWMHKLKGERFDYEINMLIKAKKHNLNFSTIPIATLYYDNNSGTHYSTIKDSVIIFIRLISGLILFSGLTIISGIIDITSFFLLNSVVLVVLHAPVRIFISTVIARITSSICNYLINRSIMFANTSKSVSSAVRYYILFTFLIMSSFILVYTVSLFWKVNESIIKLIVDIALGLVSYQVQLRWVFQNQKENLPLSIKE